MGCRDSAGDTGPGGERLLSSPQFTKSLLTLGLRTFWAFELSWSLKGGSGNTIFTVLSSTWDLNFTHSYI